MRNGATAAGRRGRRHADRHRGRGERQARDRAKGISKSYGSETIVRNLSIRIANGDRLGIVGPNGAGKTTLINLLTGGLAPDEGSVKVGVSVRATTTLDQKRETVDPDATLAEAMTEGRGDIIEVGGQRKHVMATCATSCSPPEQAKTPIAVLSGGERGRMMLARALARPSNLLVLDEPTNDLDLETLDLLEEMLTDYSGTVLLVSHDRDFLDRICTSVLMAEGRGRWTEYAAATATCWRSAARASRPRLLRPRRRVRRLRPSRRARRTLPRASSPSRTGTP